MTRNELITSPEYWITKIQMALYNCADKFMKHTGKNRKELAEHLGVSKGYVSQILGGDYDHRLSKLVELSLAFGYVPKIEFVPVDEFVKSDESSYKSKVVSLSMTYNTSTTVAVPKNPIEKKMKMIA